MLISDQVATAPCTDPIQERFRTFIKALVLSIATARNLPKTGFRVFRNVAEIHSLLRKLLGVTPEKRRKDVVK